MKSPATRATRLLPGGIPRYVRCYDNGGETADRYTVVFSGRYRDKTEGCQMFVGMDADPYHPQGFGQHGEGKPGQDIDTNKHGWAPAIGLKNHLGTRIKFVDLPPPCQRLVISDYKDIWDL